MFIGNEIKKWCEENNYNYEYIKETESTNSLAKTNQYVQKYKIFITDFQTAGRGRGKNTWLNTSPGKNLLTSWSYKINNSPQHISAPLIGLCLIHAAQCAWPQLPWSLKAPNDLFLGSKKVAGLLIESLNRGNNFEIIIGLGMNIFEHPIELQNATHLNGNDGLNNSFNLKDFHIFLDELSLGFKNMLPECTNHQLKPNRREELIIALNANPIKTSIIVDISEDGDLITDSATIAWKDL